MGAWLGALSLPLDEAPTPSAGAPAAVATTSWVEVVRAQFDDVSDGIGDGKTFPAKVGKINVVAPVGLLLKDVAPATGVFSKRLTLSDVGTLAAYPFGVDVVPSSDAKGSVLASFLLTPETDGGKLVAEITDGTTTDLGCSGDVTDGTTTELVSIEVDAGKVRVGGLELKIKATKGTTFRFEIGAYDVSGGVDFYEVRVTNLATGESEYVSGEIAGGYVTVRGLQFRKLAGVAGSFAIDDVSMLAPAN